MSLLIKKPSAWLPIAIPLAFLAYILTYIAIQGVPTPDPNADEGTAAHLTAAFAAISPVFYFKF